MPDALSTIMRWLHIASIAILVGGLLYGALALRAMAGLASPDVEQSIAERTAGRFRTRVYLTIAALIISGLYNLLSTPGHSTEYKILLGVKLLLVLHVFAVAILAVRPKVQRRARMMYGAGISGLVVILISAYLRRIF
jgi:putative copper export protein